MSLLSRFRPTPAVRVTFGALSLAVLAYLVDVRTVLARLSDLDPVWVGAALGITVLQTLLSAWRWRYTAGRLDLDLPYGEALGEYYRGIFLNQVLPGGVIGDASRAWRHASRSRRTWGGAVRAVILERASGQGVMAAFAVASLVLLAPRLGSEVTWTLVAFFGVAAAGAAVWRFGVSRASGETPLGTFLRDAHAALLTRDAFLVQLGTSSLIVGSYVVTYLCAARAVGVGTAFGTLAPLVPPVLLAMLIPLSVGGWGLREGAAAGLWAAVGLVAADGVAISVAYGVVVLLGTLPGAYLVFFRGLGSGGTGASGAPDEVRSSSKRMSSPRTK